MAFDLDNMYCGAIKRGDLFLCLLENDKEQAVVVLQDSILNERLGTVMVVPIVPYDGGRTFKNEIVLKENETGFGNNGLCMLHKLCVVKREQFIAKKGELNLKKLQEIYGALDINLGRFRD